MEVKFSDTQKVEEILQVITPLKESIPCSLIVKDVAKRKDSLPRNDGQYCHIFDKLFVTVETELVKLAIASPGFTICFEEAYDHFHVDKNLKSSIRRNLRKSVFFESEHCNVFSLNLNIFTTLLISKSTKLWLFFETFESITCYLFVFKNFVLKLISEL